MNPFVAGSGYTLIAIILIICLAALAAWIWMQ